MNSDKKQQTLKAIQELGQKLSDMGAERGHWLVLDVRALYNKAENYWSESPSDSLKEIRKQNPDSYLPTGAELARRIKRLVIAEKES